LRYSERGREREAFVLRRLGVLYAFINECPHWSVELDLGDGHFYDEQLDRIYCKNHGALFHVESGLCETGPCLGRSLEGLALEVDGPDVLVHLPGEPDGAAASASETP
jgi:nitrite reductase/ring-hydroxylating ferredoxin subunit